MNMSKYKIEDVFLAMRSIMLQLEEQMIQENNKIEYPKTIVVKGFAKDKPKGVKKKRKR